MFFNPIFIKRFSGSRIFRVQVFLGLGFPQGLVPDFRMGQGFSGSEFRVEVQRLGSGFRSSLNEIEILLSADL